MALEPSRLLVGVNFAEARGSAPLVMDEELAMPKHISEFVIALAFLALAPSQEHPMAGQDSTSLVQRPLKLPSSPSDDPCPITVGSRETVPNQKHIFGGSLWFGTGPVYFALAWKATDDDDATFGLDRVPVQDGARRAKTPWVSVPSYSGPILIRGRALDASARELRFSKSPRGPSDSLHLEAPQAPSAGLWSFWPTSMWVPGPGCYGLQIDTLAGTEIVVFRAT
jgi:hypothetical protein